MTQSTLSKCCAISLTFRTYHISRHRDLPSIHIIFHGTRTYRPYVPNFTVQGLAVHTYQISRYKDLPSVHTKFHGARTCCPYVPNFTVQGLNVRTYQISRYRDLPSVHTKFNGTRTYRPTYQISRYRDLPSIHTKFHGTRIYLRTHQISLTRHSIQTLMLKEPKGTSRTLGTSQTPLRQLPSRWSSYCTKHLQWCVLLPAATEPHVDKQCSVWTALLDMRYPVEPAT
jgi:hypothetical protein